MTLPYTAFAPIARKRNEKPMWKLFQQFVRNLFFSFRRFWHFRASPPQNVNRSKITVQPFNNLTKMPTATETIEDLVKTEYKYGFVTDVETESTPPGLSEDTIRLISPRKNERAWLLEWRPHRFAPCST